jgi:hypothetical protein
VTEKSLDEIAGLLITKPVEGSETPKEPVVVADQDATPGETGEADGEVWTSGEDADEASLAEHLGEADGETGESGDAGTKASAEAAERDNEPSYTVTIDGKQVQVPLSEALAGYQRTQDYTRKTTEVAEQRKSVGEQLELTRRVRETYDGLLKGVQEQVEGSLNVKPETWEALKAEDPAKFAAAWAEHQQRQEARNAIVAERQRVANEQKAEQTQKIREYVSGERTKLLDKIPEWKDPAKYTTGAKTILEFAGKEYGFSDAELAQAYDHRMILMARDAQRYRALVAKASSGKAKLDKAPPVQPRGRVPVASMAARTKQEATQRFHRTGKVDDAVALLLTR